MNPQVLDDSSARVMLALVAWLLHDESVEAIITGRPPVSSAGKIKTCPECGDSGAIGQFFYESNPTYCKSCTTSKINAHIHELNEATRDSAENHRQPWSELEIEMLLGAVAEGMHAKDIAEMLGRTYLSVHGKLGNLRKLIAEGRAITTAIFEIHTSSRTTVTVHRDPNYVASAPDEDRWWEASYYTKGDS